MTGNGIINKYLSAGIFCLWMFSPVVALGQNQTRIDKIEKSWISWISKNRVGVSSIAISYEGRLARSSAIGTSSSSRFPLASLSKAITGACIRGLVSGKKLTEETTIGDIFPNEFKNSNITVGQLLSHTSGLGPDSTQRNKRAWVNNSNVQHQEVARNALSRSKQNGRSGKFFYNNENYAILGAIVEHVTGRTYEQYCSAKVLKPAGISSGRLSQRWGGFGAWGGWEMSMPDYAIFVAENFGKSMPYGRQPGDWATANLGEIKYGLGAFYRKSGSAYNFWHFGSHCFGGDGNVGSFFASWQGKWSVVIAYNACLSGDQMQSLDAQMMNSALR